MSALELSDSGFLICGLCRVPCENNQRIEQRNTKQSYFEYLCFISFCSYVSNVRTYLYVCTTIHKVVSLLLEEIFHLA